MLGVDDRVRKDWEQCASMFANAAAKAWEALAQHPTERSDRQHRLKGDLEWGSFEGRQLPRWQYEFSGGGRIWYLVEPGSAGAKGPQAPGRVLVEKIHFGHPKRTE